MSNVISFAERKAVGDDHETRVRRELESRGWTVDPYGQGVLSDNAKQALQRTESPMRWDPDMIATRGLTVCLIDAKGSTKGDDAHTYWISRKALAAGRELWERADLPFYYVFANLGVATPAEIMQFCRVETNRRRALVPHVRIRDGPAVRRHVRRSVRCPSASIASGGMTAPIVPDPRLVEAISQLTPEARRDLLRFIWELTIADDLTPPPPDSPLA